MSRRSFEYAYFNRCGFDEGEIWKSSGGQWGKAAFKEGDYLCRDAQSVPKSVLKALKIKCID